MPDVLFQSRSIKTYNVSVITHKNCSGVVLSELRPLRNRTRVAIFPCVPENIRCLKWSSPRKLVVWICLVQRSLILCDSCRGRLMEAWSCGSNSSVNECWDKDYCPQKGSMNLEWNLLTIQSLSYIAWLERVTDYRQLSGRWAIVFAVSGSFQCATSCILIHQTTRISRVDSDVFSHFVFCPSRR